MPDFDKIKLGNTAYNVKDATAREALEGVEERLLNLEGADGITISYDAESTAIVIGNGG